MKKILLIIIFLLSMVSAALEVRVVALDNIYDAQAVLGIWETHHYYTYQVQVVNTGALAQLFDRVEANTTFSIYNFNYIDRHDLVNGWSATNFFTVNNGQVQYQRAANTGEAVIQVPAYSVVALYEVTLQVKDDAALALSPINILPQFTHVLSGVSDVTGQLHSVSLSLIEDQTAPVTRVIPSETLHARTALTVMLEAVPDQMINTHDLAGIYYTLDGSLPTLASTRYSSAIYIPVNTDLTLRWIAVDTAGNQSVVQSARYVVDAVNPVVESVDLSSVQALAGSKVTINVLAQDNISIDSITVLVGSVAAVMVKPGVFVYSVPSIVDTTVPIIITVRDHAGNQAQWNGSLVIDSTPPVFKVLSIEPRTASIGDQVRVVFTSSEPLVLEKLQVSIGTNAPAMLEAYKENTYTYSRVIDGTETSGWILVHGYDQAGNHGYNLAETNTIHIAGKDLVGNYGEGSAILQVSY